MKIKNFRGLQRLIQERVAPIIERGDTLFNNLRDIQERRIERHPSRPQEVPQPLPGLEQLRDYQQMLGLENFSREPQGGYSSQMIKDIREVKYIDVSGREPSRANIEEVCSICHDLYTNTDNVKVLS